MDGLATSLYMTVVGAAWTIIFTLLLRSDRYIQHTVKSVLKSRRQEVTPDAIARLVPGLKAALIMGIVICATITVLGAITLVIGVTKVLRGS